MNTKLKTLVGIAALVLIPAMLWSADRVSQSTYTGEYTVTSAPKRMIVEFDPYDPLVPVLSVAFHELAWSDNPNIPPGPRAQRMWTFADAAKWPASNLVDGVWLTNRVQYQVLARKAILEVWADTLVIANKSTNAWMTIVPVVPELPPAP
jgi:hypothetical protein